MKKIQTLFERSEDRRSVIDVIHPGCEWVANGEGRATRKWDGTCIKIADDGGAWARREVKPGKEIPPLFVEADHDTTTGKTVGWEPALTSGFREFIGEAIGNWRRDHDGQAPPPGTYELVGPKINGNPENCGEHELYPHGNYEMADAPRTYDALRDYLQARPGVEGIVWHHPDGRMVKIKRRDFK